METLGILLDKYYERHGDSVITDNDPFFMKTFVFGDGYYTATEPPRLLPIPKTLGAVPNVFFTGTPVMSRKGRTLTISCSVAAGQVTASKKFSMVGILDNKGNLVVASTNLPFYLDATSVHEAKIYVNLPIPEAPATAAAGTTTPAPTTPTTPAATT